MRANTVGTASTKNAACHDTTPAMTPAMGPATGATALARRWVP